MKRVFPIILTILLLAACMENRPAGRAMEQAAALMDTRPDSALGILLALPGEDSAAMTEGQRMQWLLLRQQGMNKCDTVFRSDSIPLLLVEWFDRHGTPNEQVLAHYLLGRAYADMGESPAALQAYLEAVAKADTTMADADFGLLSRVYSQMASIYRRKALRYEDLEALEKAEQYSLKDKDTVTAHIYSNIRADTYYLMGVTDTAMAIREKEIRYFTEKGRNDVVAIMKGASVSALLSLGQTEKARRYLAVSEDSSGFVNPDGTAVHGHEIYYYNKGMYYMAVHKPDSAEIYFRRLQRDGLNLNDHIAACEGLARVYEARGRNDSVAKYLRLSGQLNDSAYSRAEADGMLQMKAEYDYTRSVMQAQASQVKKERAEKRLAILLTGFLVLLAVLALLFFFLFGNYKRKQERRLQATNQDYVDALTAYQALASEIKILKMTSAASEALIRQKEDSAGELERVLANSQTDEAGPGEWKDGQEVFSNTVVMTLHKMAVRGVKITDEDLIADIFSFVNSNIPGFLAEIEGRHGNLRQQHRLVCVLTRLRFVPSEISTLLGLSPSSLSNLRRRLLRKLFHEEGPAFRFDERIRQMA